MKINIYHCSLCNKTGNYEEVWTHIYKDKAHRMYEYPKPYKYIEETNYGDLK